MKKVCWALADKQGNYHRSVDFEFYEPILPQLFRTKKQAEEFMLTNRYFRKYQPQKVVVSVKHYLS